MKLSKQSPKYLYLSIGINQLEEITKNGLTKVKGKEIYLAENKKDAFVEGKIFLKNMQEGFSSGWDGFTNYLSSVKDEVKKEWDEFQDEIGTNSSYKELLK